MRDILLDETTNDLALDVAGRASLTSTVEQETAQRLYTRLSWFLGEWILDTTRGVPYFRDVFIKNPDLGVIRSVLAEQIAADPGVSQLLTLDVEVDNATRVMSVAFTALLVSGEQLSSSLDLAQVVWQGRTLTLDDGSAISP